MRVVFFGTPAPAAIALEALLASPHQVAAVVTQPDRPRGRSGAPAPPPAKERAAAGGIPVLQPASPRDGGFADALAECRPEACAVVAYGHILPPAVLAVPAKGTVNVHFSLLPRYRGAAPVQRAIMSGETETGVTTFLLEPTLDTGPILKIESETIHPEDTAGTLMDRLSLIGARLLLETLDELEAGTATPRAQDAAAATPAPKIRPEEAEIDWTRPSWEITNLIRAMNPSPGAFGTFRGKRVKVWRAGPVEGAAGSAPGAVHPMGKDRFAIATGDGAVEIIELQLEGSRRLDAASFMRGHRLESGASFSGE